jgi:UDP-2,3-diacylglucosamine pyrophosphatase LpxH
MLAIISDLHLTDGSSGSTISAAAFEIFADELRDQAANASWRSDGRYRPIERIDVLLLGDVLDLIRSSQWLARPDVRPWDDPRRPEYSQLLTQITQDILRHNESSLAILRAIATTDPITLPPADGSGRPVAAAAGVPVRVDLHYLVGNHDWFFHLPGSEFNALRQLVVRQLGLTNSPDTPFPHDPVENGELSDILRRHRVFARHGDVFDPFNFEGDRRQSSLGDAIVIELLNKFAVQVAQQIGDDLPYATLLGLRELDNVRPLLFAPVWIDGLLERTCPQPQIRKEVKAIWDRLVDEFLALPFVRAHNTWQPGAIDGLEDALRFSKRVSIGWASKIIEWLQQLRGQSNDSYYPHALAEADFRNRRAKYIVYGHTHTAESVPLDASHAEGSVLNQIYFNSGTWRRVLRPTVMAPNEHEFIPSDVMTYLTFYQGDERQGRPFETWTGMLGILPADVPNLRVDPGRTSHVRSQPVSASSVHGLAPHFTVSPGAGRVVPTRRIR